MGDHSDIYQAMNDDRRERHAGWKKLNMQAMAGSGLKYREANNGESLLFRENGKPKVDFYPSTGRWRVAGMRQTFRGGTKKFLQWYKNQS